MDHNLSSSNHPASSSFLDLLNENEVDTTELLDVLAASAEDIPAATFHVSGLETLGTLDTMGDFKEGNLEVGLEIEGYEEELEDAELDESYDELEAMEEIMDESGTDIQHLISRAQASGGDLTMGTTQFWDDDFELEEFNTELRRASGIGRRKRDGGTRGGPSEPSLPPEIKAALGEANLHYINREYGEAIEIYQEVIRKNPNVHQAWVNLGLIQEELGNPAKALQLSLVAAHLRPKDGEAWKRLARMSTEQGAIRQAIYCYSKAIQADPTDVDAIWDRSYLHKEIKKYNLAITGFTKLLELAPHHTKVIDELAKIYRETNQPEQAIPLYESAMKHHFSHTAPPPSADENTFGYTELNMLAELLMMQGDHARALEVIKAGVRHLQGRQRESWWDRFEDEREFEDDGEGDGAAEGNERWDVPLELRVKMGVCRIMGGQVDEAKVGLVFLGLKFANLLLGCSNTIKASFYSRYRHVSYFITRIQNHFKYLYAQPVAAYPDLYLEVAEAFMERRLYVNALAVFEAMLDGGEAVDIEVLIQVGDCHRELGNLDNAAEYYGAVIEELPDKLDVKMALAQVYEELGEEERAFELVTQVMKSNKEAKLKKKEAALAAAATTASLSGPRTRSRIRLTTPAPSTSDTEPFSTTPSRSGAASLFDEDRDGTVPGTPGRGHRPASEKARLAAREHRAREERELEQTTLAKFEELWAVGAKLDDRRWARGERRDVFEFMRIAEGLWTDFRATKEFYPADRMKVFTGRRTWTMRRPRKSNIEEEVEMEKQVNRMASRLRGRLKGTMSEVEVEVEVDSEDVEEERMPKAPYAILLATNHRKQEAYDVLKAASDANVFYHDEGFRIGLKLVLMAVQ
ncbi:hypothetical protein BC938DRAFT_484013 [Jimgerdemannia flammicorona]|uniref:TPR-like protein n=1 Tax=Jimgerdemannia flammicorona TaxID=994334 RepID=A0A433QAQ4_9FUNG|nr:hypothetical protein BC938DRAFT_484013 [Jimgerdemannia flammicorona]